MPTTKERFTVLLSTVAREVMRRRSSEACCGDLTLEQFETLRVVAGSESATIGSLSAALEVDLSTMSRNVSVLGRNGYIQRSRSPDDGRIVLVKLTRKGRNALTTLQCGERDVLGDIYDRLPASERASVSNALESLRSCFAEDGAPIACCLPTSLGRRSV